MVFFKEGERLSGLMSGVWGCSFKKKITSEKKKQGYYVFPPH